LIFPWNFAEFENSPANSTIFDLMMYFYHGKKLSKAVGTVVNKCNAIWQIAHR